jgi:hypothetical protein
LSSRHIQDFTSCANCPSCPTSSIATTVRDICISLPPVVIRGGLAHLLIFAYATTNEAAPAFAVFESWAPRTRTPWWLGDFRYSKLRSPLFIHQGAGPSLIFAYATTNEAAPPFVIFESWAPHSLRGAGPSLIFAYATTNEAAPAFAVFEGWAPRTRTPWWLGDFRYSKLPALRCSFTSTTPGSPWGILISSDTLLPRSHCLAHTRLTGQLRSLIGSFPSEVRIVASKVPVSRGFSINRPAQIQRINNPPRS